MNPKSTTGPVPRSTKGVKIQVHAQPGAKRTELVGLHGDALKIRVQAPPLEGRANDELLRFIAETLGISRSQVTLVQGDKSRSKTFEVTGIELESVRKSLSAWLNG